MLWLGYKEIKSHWSNPRQVFTGWSTQREKQLNCQSVPDLPVWISGGTPKDAEQVFAKAGIDRSRLKLTIIVDTVTNFTTLVDEFQARGIKKTI